MFKVKGVKNSNVRIPSCVLVKKLALVIFLFVDIDI